MNGCKEANASRIGQDGVTLVEALVSSALGLVILSGLLSLFDLNNRVGRDQSDVVAMQANARAALEFVGRDLAEAGFGLTQDSLESAGVVFPNTNDSDSYTTDSITLWTNPSGIRKSSLQNMLNAWAPIIVDDLGGLEVGSDALVLGLGSDDQLHFDWFVITDLVEDPVTGDRLVVHDAPQNSVPFSTVYRAGAVVLPARRVRYFVAIDEADVSQLRRQVGSGPAYAVADHVSAVAFAYYDGGDPRQQIDPVDGADDRQDVRSVELMVTATTSRPALDTGEPRSYTLTSEILPRNLAYLGGS